MMKYQSGVLLLAGLFVLPSCSRDESPSLLYPSCNVLLISLDTLRADHLGCYGYGRDTSPHLDRFAKEAVLFKNALSQGTSTLPSHASTFTSLIPSHHGAFFNRGTALPSEIPTMAEILKDRGFATASFNNGGQISSIYGMDQGFDEYHSFLGVESVLDSLFSTVVDAGKSWLSPPRERPFFLFLHTYEVHDPYTPERRLLRLFEERYEGALPVQVIPRPFAELWGPQGERKEESPPMSESRILRTEDREIIPHGLIEKINFGSVKLTEEDKNHLISAYDAEVRSLDEAFGDLVAFLKAQGLYENSLIIVSSDHGEEFGEHGKMARHAHTLFDELLKVVLMIKLPDGTFAGRAVEEPVRNIDILPTVCELLGIPPLEIFQGESLLGLLQGNPSAERFAVSQMARKDKTLSTAIRTSRWKLYDKKLYDLAADPGERNDVSAEHPQVKQSLREVLSDILDKPPIDVEERRAGSDSETERQLRELGY